MAMIEAWVARAKGEAGGWTRIDTTELPDRPVTVAVSHSAVNYKDGLAITGKGPIFRSFPAIPGIDIAGSVIADKSGTFAPGTEVIATGWGIGETTPGGYAREVKLEPGWLVRRPDGLSAVEAAAIGTAGLTAALSVLALERYGITPADGPVLVTGATGGVGGHAVMLLSAAGYDVVAVTGRMAEADYLKGLGAKEVIDRAEFDGEPRPLGKERWPAAVDVVGGKVLANVLSMIRYGGAVAASGLAQSMALPTSVAPFILRGVALLGVESVSVSAERRAVAWERIARDIDHARLKAMTAVHPFSEADRLAADLIDQKLRGRAVLAW
jgi:acrylyl-CoA reductase (NADPH)